MDQERTLSQDRQRRVLVVDEDQQNVEIVRGHLEAMGFEVSTAASGHVALSQIVLEAPRSPIHGVILDSDRAMPQSNSVVREIKGWNPAIRIIMMSSRGERPEILKAFKDGADDLIEKPINPEVLKQKCLKEFLR